MSFCEVDFGAASDDAEPVEFVDYRMVVAKKEHQCSECGGVITKGERHRVAAYKFEGKFACDRTCDPCHEAAGEFSYNMLGGDLWLMFAEEWDNGASVQACINRLTTARAKEHMRAQWTKWREKRAAALQAHRQKLRDLVRRPQVSDPDPDPERAK